MIIRAASRRRFTIVPNQIIEDENINWPDLGLLIYLLSKPNHWQVSPTQLARAKKAGRDAIYASLKRLSQLGYASLKRNSDGTTDWIITDTVHAQGDPILDNPDTANSPIGKTQIGKSPNGDFPAQVSTEVLKVKTEAVAKDSLAVRRTSHLTLAAAFAESGFQHQQIHTPKVTALLQCWYEAGVTPQDVLNVINIIRARDPTKRFSPAYLEKPMIDYLEAMKNDVKSGERNNPTTGKKETAAERMWRCISPGLGVQ